MDFDSCKRAIASIHHSTSEQIVGTGFLVAERYLLTCDHVINAAISGDVSLGQQISVRFPLVGQGEFYTTEVVEHWYEGTDLGVCRKDYALLRLLSPLPESVTPIPFRCPIPGNANLQVFGFPKGDAIGRNLTAANKGLVGSGWLQIQDSTQTGLGVEGGFSGAPVWCDKINACVGMVVARDRKRPEAKVGFIIPTEQLAASLRETNKFSLQDILQPHVQAIEVELMAAYQLCRPKNWSKPWATKLSSILSDLSIMPDGEAGCSRLLQFVACLLNQPLDGAIRQPLRDWARPQADNLDDLCKQMLAKLQCAKPPLRSHPSLLISIKPDKNHQDSYEVKGWLIKDVTAYNPTTGEGAEQLSSTEALQRYAMENDPQAAPLDPEAGVSLNDIPNFLADYLDQVGSRNIDLQTLTVELFVPLALLNNELEQWLIPDEFDEPLILGKECGVIARSQERLDGYRYRGLWQTKWQQLKQQEDCEACSLFVLGATNLRQELKAALGLKLAQPPNTERGGELALLLRNATPIALWVRQSVAEIDWGEKMDSLILNGCLKAIPERVTQVRRDAPDLDPTDPPPVLDLGHHLSFVWEDPQRVPPTIQYSGKTL